MHKSEADTGPKPTEEHLPIVVLGASAGGLEALKAFFSGAPDKAGCIYLVITHHKSEKQSMLPELLARSSGKRAVEIADGMAPEPDCIYTNPATECFITLEGGKFRLLSAREASTYTPQLDKYGNSLMKVYHPIDFTFQQLAQEVGGRLTGIVLSGSGSDGAIGLRAVKGQDGMIMVQQPESAEFSGMPDNAIATGLADFILSPEDMGAQLASYLRHRKTLSLGKGGEELISADQLRQICELLRERVGHDFLSYKPNTMKRRVAKRMALHRLRKASDYLEYLYHNEDEANHLFRDMLIRVTEFFRDPGLWDYCRNDLFPEVLQQHDYSDGFRVWVAGCSTGDEAYSIAILLNEVLRENNLTMRVHIFASDLDAEAISIARRGEYPAGIVNEVPEPLLSRYFSYSEDRYKIHKSVREQIIFAPHNVIKDPPFTNMDLISCRNLLIYLNQDLQADLISLFHMSLRNKGTLVLGPSESVGETSTAFKTVNSKWKVFRRNPDIFSERVPMQYFHGGRRTDRSLYHAQATAQPRLSDQPPIAEKVLKLLAKKFAPGALVISERGDIFYLHGDAGKFLEPAEGKPRYNIFEMGRGDLPRELPAMMHSAASSEGRIVEKKFKIDPSGDSHVLVGVEKLQAPESMRGLFLIFFHDIETTSTSPTVTAEAGESQDEDEPASQVFALERDLEKSRASYRALLEQVEDQNAELRSAVEELQSTNEELQSSNEELETSKEETQSLYEELSTINSELVEKVNSLSDANNDMANLLNSTAMAILYLDNELKLKRFTQKAKDIVAVRESDEGRPIGELAIHLKGEQFIEDARSVLSTLRGIEKEVRTNQGGWYLMKLLPYRTRDNVVDGLICTFVDINEVKRSKRSESHFRELLWQLPRPFLLVDSTGVVVQITVAMAKALQLDGQSVEGMRLTDAVREPQSSDGIEQCLKAIFEGRQKTLQLAVQPIRTNSSAEASTLQLEIRKLPVASSESELAWVGLL
ncbi:PAS domain-containing protein [Marinobacter panjinensis]|uniref:protein-glutamate O-methyltransferase n=1 Tax=Marinobacter panjinensis TaxID=2576384 RepID=A0A4U6R286_9GAMM|nr:CheR family methyltransferase [Marinobacter panjinensis]MCR8915656.1 PAS domain-containing protein [Marinobacter panjinensis]TKV66898.1 PAS domain-containing protein [Marinobacter panjinensis]